MKKAIIEVDNLSWRREQKTLLHNVNWTVNKGEHWAILGLNGSGKTTLLNMINGYLWPTTGTVSVFEEQFGTIDLRELRKSIGWVSSSLQERLSAGDKAQSVVMSGKFASIGLYDEPTKEDEEYAIELMGQLRCSHLIDRRYQTCSQGEKQKLLIARALMASPKLLILDEPCNGLDFISREQLLSSIERLAQRPDAPTLIYVTHHTEEIVPIFGHCLLMRRGEVFQTGKTKEVLTESTLTEFFETGISVHWHNDRAILTWTGHEQYQELD
ncbi:ABC transporter ATP-binding protein [Cohnella sp. LGH]|uniref:Iron complex transport system ATP-binding protein n=1 Tax=Cohnella phaseoli TaxID=456490 RepID=A0A3D9I0X9_9BACL|nr:MULTISPECIES: ABC transporter ATP-binding protein [Cohnella]QTH40952.1 ABC transporter ATP-binding protein [Cohnella sp. LGH]RED55394.1 iron complex transport system ATP-binding protein [Cohnella phaseoli]